MAQIGIIGLGLIGASLGLALKASNRRDITVSGYDRSERNAARAREMGAVDTLEASAIALAERADIVIVATPIIAIRRTFQEIAPALRHGAIVTDVASIKAEVLQAAAEVLPDHVHFVGGHPMAGGDTTGPEGAHDRLFVDDEGRPRTYCIVPSVHASNEAIRAVAGIAELAGANPVLMDAREHDALVAAVSHMPILLSVALFTMARGSVSWKEIAPLAGPAFHDLTRLAKGSPEMALDIFAANRQNVLHWLQRYQDELHRLRELLMDEERPLHELLVRAQSERQAFEAAKSDKDEADPEADSASDHILAFMVGERLVERTKELTRSLGRSARRVDRYDERERERRAMQGGEPPPDEGKPDGSR